MTEVAIEALEDHIGESLQKAHDGERVVVTRNGRPFAVLSGVSEERAIEPIQGLVRSGEANWKGGKPCGASSPVKIRGKSAARMVIEDRR